MASVFLGDLISKLDTDDLGAFDATDLLKILLSQYLRILYFQSDYHS
jgi:hypothetical protein